MVKIKRKRATPKLEHTPDTAIQLALLDYSITDLAPLVQAAERLRAIRSRNPIPRNVDFGGVAKVHRRKRGPRETVWGPTNEQEPAKRAMRVYYVEVYDRINSVRDPETILSEFERYAGDRVLKRLQDARRGLVLEFENRTSKHSQTRLLLETLLTAAYPKWGIKERDLLELVPVKKFPEIRRELSANSGT